MKYIYHILLLAISLTCASCVSELLTTEPGTSDTDGVKFSFICEDNQNFKVGTRAVVDKTSAETEINKLCIFFFNSSGNPLPLTDAGIASNIFGKGTNYSTTYIEGNQTVITLMSSYFGSGRGTADIYVVANFDDTFDPTQIKTRNDIIGYRYCPTSERNRNITKLPDGGMPMYGYKTVDLSNDQVADPEVRLKALMAKIELSININSDNHDASNTYPRYYITEWTVGNKANGVLLGNNDNIDAEAEGGEATSFVSGITKDDYKYSKTVTIQQAGNSYNEVFYIFENKQVAEELSADLGFVESLENTGKERYKVLRANEDASYVKMVGTFHDASGGQSKATLTFYLGGNNYDDFNVKRNSHYNNYITITGLMSNSNLQEDMTHVYYDSRVYVEGTESTPYFLSVLREHDVDAHFGITPVDFYFYDKVYDEKLQIEIVASNNTGNTRWIALEKVEAQYMQNGTLPTAWTNSHINAGKLTAGHGKRKYFLTDMLTNTTHLPNTSCEIENTQDRIYIYVDENLSTKGRSATLKITYLIKENANSDWKQSGDIREIAINQRGLLPVTVTKDNESHTLYIEQIEEYLDNYDPYDEYNSNQLYTGLPWGMWQDYVGSSSSDEWCNVYMNGHQATYQIISQGGQTVLSLKDRPRSAAEYCYNKNKRNSSGAVQNNLNVNNNPTGWFLPGITQLEALMTQHQNLFSSFRTEFYWSSAAGKRRERVALVFYRYPEDQEYARATRYNYENNEDVVDDDGNVKEFIQSDWDDTYTGKSGIGGKALRTEALRIRAVYRGNVSTN